MSALTKRRLAFALGLSLAAPASAQQGANGSMIIDVPMAKPQSAPLAAPAPPKQEARPAPRAGDGKDGAPASSSARATPQQAAPIVEEGDKPDETALRYYAMRNEMTRVNTEIERLVRLYPGWTPPLDLFNQEQTGGPNEDALWAMFTDNRIEELRATIEARKKEEPGWEPSKDLATKLRRKELRQRIMAFWREGRWQDLVDYVKRDDYQADDADVELLWTIAEAFSKTKQNPEALSVYRSILNSSADQPARLATIHKAMASLRMNDVETLIAMGRRDSAGRIEFAPIQTDITRARISAYLHDERVEKIPDAELAAFQEFAKTASDPNQPGLVAWYFYKTKVHRQALEWFKLALEHGGDAMIAHGLAHSLRELDMKRETEEVAYAWRQPLVNNLILFIDILERDLTLEFPPYIEPERLARYAQVTMDVASGEGAQALAWYAYNSCQFEVAHQWFQRAVAWFPKEATVYGYALTLKRLKRDREFWEVQNRYDGLFGKVLEIVFPDGYYHPPTPCDQVAQPARPQPHPLGAYVAPGPYAAQPSAGYAYGATAAQAAGYAMSGAGQGAYAQRQDMPKIDRRLFPAATDPENQLRYGAGAPLAPRHPAQLTPAAPDIALQREPVRGPWALVASRVPGVGRMPYERYGFALLPGWNGVTGPTSPTYAMQLAPKGTLWETDMIGKKASALGLSSQNVGAGAGVANPGFSMSGMSGMSGVSGMASMYGASAMSGGGVSGAAATSGAATPVAPAAPPPTAVPAAPRNVGAAISAPAPQALAALAAPAAPPKVELSAAPSMAIALPEAADAGALAQRAMQFFNQKNYAAAIEALDQRAPLARETTELKMIRGWSLLHLQRKDEARKVFATLGASSAGSSSSSGASGANSSLQGGK